MLVTFLRRVLKGRKGPADGARTWRSIAVLALYLATIGALHVGAMMSFEGMALGDAAWLTMTTVTTVGYGDVSAASAAGRVSTVVLLYVGGIFALAKGAGDYFDFRAARRLDMIRGRWRWNLHDHVLLINAPATGAEPYFETLVREFRATDWGAERDVLILTEQWPDGLPASLRRLDVIHVHGSGAAEDGLAAADAAKAAAIIVLARDAEKQSDGITFDIVHRLAALGRDGPVLAECVDDRNRERIRDAGASAVLRPMRGYPEMMVRAVIAPGSEQIIVDLFTSGGDECVRYDVAITGVSWGVLAVALIGEGVGTPIAYADAATGAIESNPLADRAVDARAIYLLVKEGQGTSIDDVRSVAASL
jgi:voltage-gated potassium channel